MAAHIDSRPGSRIAAATGGVYIHIPFCKAKCMYCDFYSVADRDTAMNRLVDCLLREIRDAGGSPPGWQIDTLFIGGGTPSLLAPHHLEQLIAALDQAFGLNELVEFTLEANPGEAPEDKLRAFRELGVNRLSMGFQSFDPGLLKFLGRLHDPAACFKTYAAARRAGFDNINADLMFNIPGQSLRRWRADLTALADLEPEHISAYSLTVEKGTELSRMVAAGEVALPDEDRDYRMYALTRELLSRRGYVPYEVSNYAREGRACRHNLHYWRIEPYLSFGPAAHGFDGLQRRWNVRNLDEYMDRIETGRSPVAGDEDLNPDQLYHEKLAFGLRLKEGLSVTESLGYASPRAFARQHRRLLTKWEGWLVLQGDRLQMTETGVFLTDTVTADFFTEGAPGESPDTGSPQDRRELPSEQDSRLPAKVPGPAGQERPGPRLPTHVAVD